MPETLASDLNVPKHTVFLLSLIVLQFPDILCIYASYRLKQFGVLCRVDMWTHDPCLIVCYIPWKSASCLSETILPFFTNFKEYLGGAASAFLRTVICMSDIKLDWLWWFYSLKQSVTKWRNVKLPRQASRQHCERATPL